MFRLSPRPTRGRGLPTVTNGGSRRAFGALLAVAGVTSAMAVGSPGTASAATPVTINLITTNDFHGRIERSTPSAGAAAIATAVKNFRIANPNTVFAAAGDLIGASTFTSFIQQDVPTIDALNAAGLEVSAVGNHEFDQGYNDLMNRVLPLANWEYIGANVKTTNGDPNLPEYWVKDMAGVKMGFIGAVTDELPSLVSPAGIANLTIEAPVTAANRVADLLTDGNAGNGEADVIVLLVHEGAATTDIASATDPTSRFGQIVNGASSKIDAIVSGHTHLAYNHVISGRPVISSGQYGEKFSNMVISVDPDTKDILSMTNTVYDAFAYTSALTPDPTVASIVSAAVTAADGPGSVVLGSVTADFNRGNFAAAGDNRGTESTLGNFVADVQLWSANQNGHADIALMNPGGLRADLAYAPDGSITFKEAAAVQPFANTLVTLDMTGAQLKLALEQQWQPAGSSRPVLRLGLSKGLTYVYDPTAPAGSHVTRIVFNGADVLPTQVFRVVANSFLGAGGDSFFAIGQGTNKIDSGKIDLQSMVDYFAANLTATPDPAQRSVGIHLSAPDSNGYSSGDSLTIDLSSLDFTTNEIKSGTAQLTLGGISLGSVAINPAKVAAVDEAGRGQLVATIPPGLSGVQQLVVTVPATGTTASLPITIVGPPPAAPSALAAVSVGADVHLTWTDNASDELGFDVMRARLVAGVWTEWTVVGTPGPDAVSLDDLGAAPGQYAYLVRARNAGGASDWAIALVEHPVATAPPLAPTAPTAVSSGANVVFSWTDNATTEQYFEVQRARYNATTNTWGEWVSQVADRDATTITDTAVPAGRYAYLVRASNGAGSSDWAITVIDHTTATTAPDAPSGLAAVASGSSVNLSWVDNAVGEIGYEVQRARWDGTDWVEWTSWSLDLNSVSMTDTPVPAGSYAYLVRAYNPHGASDWVVTTITV